MLLLASAMLVSIGASTTPVRADIKCGYPISDGGAGFYSCWSMGFIEFDYDELTPAERDYIANLRARLDEKEGIEMARIMKEAREEKERERIRISKCNGTMVRVWLSAKRR
jgi:hypothetical protein